ncbi:MAG TPA: hypothetical protein VN317_05600 [Candidatus Methanoperedens sp.]|nr:hypothetical protein [Candidatus Methanoperedens sp.]
MTGPVARGVLGDRLLGRSGLAKVVPLWLAAVATAVAVRVYLLGDKPFWRDEAWVALLSQEGLPAILSTPRPTPVGFVLLVKLAGLIPGLPPEVSLRLVPLLCGLAAVAALPRLARALGAPPAVSRTALLLAATAPPLVYYSRELKHYSVDLLLAVLVPLLAIRFFRRDATSPDGTAPRGGVRALAATLLAAPWVSFASVFPIAGALGWGWVQPWRSAPAATRRRWVAFTLLYALSFALAYTTTMGRQAGNPGLLEFWRKDLSQRDALSLPLRLGAAIADCIGVPLSYFFPGLELIALPLAALGLAGWARPGASILRTLALATLAPTVVAVTTGRYPSAQGRLFLFAAPLLLLCIASGLAELGRLLGPAVGARVAAALPLAFGTVAALAWGGAAVAHRLPPYRNDPGRYFRYDVLHDVEPLIAAVGRRAAPSEPVLVTPFADYPCRWYARGRLAGATVLTTPLKGAEKRRMLRAWAGRGRSWMLLLDEEAASFERAIAKVGLERSLAASARGAQLWEVRRSGSARKPPAGPRTGRAGRAAGPATD